MMSGPSRRRRRRGRCLPIVARRARRARRRGRMFFGLAGTIFLFILVRGLLTSGLALALAPLRPTGRSGPDVAEPDPPETPPLALSAAARPSPRPPEDGVAWAIKFLVRNRGRPGPITERAWRILDRSSLPLAVYLRDAEERNDWSNLERELRVPLPPDRPRHRDAKLIAAAARWERRGLEVMFPSDEIEAALADVSTVETSSRPPGP